MDQFTPHVTHEDVERILQRDFPAEHWEELRKIIKLVQVRETDRVILACMKNAGGDVQKLKGNLNEATGDYREIIGEAEYPFYSKKIFRIEQLTEKEKSAVGGGSCVHRGVHSGEGSPHLSLSVQSNIMIPALGEGDAPFYSLTIGRFVKVRKPEEMSSSSGPKSGDPLLMKSTWRIGPRSLP